MLTFSFCISVCMCVSVYEVGRKQMTITNNQSLLILGVSFSTADLSFAFYAFLVVSEVILKDW